MLVISDHDSFQDRTRNLLRKTHSISLNSLTELPTRDMYLTDNSPLKALFICFLFVDFLCFV